MNSLIICCIVNLLLVKFEASDGVCINTPSSICECFNSSKTSLSIECCDDKVIILESGGATLLYEQFTNTCTQSQGTSFCLVKEEDNFRLNHQDKVNIYNNCSGKNRCNVTINPSGNIKVQIPLTCEPAPKTCTLSENSSTNFVSNYPIIYISGKDYIGKEINFNFTAKAELLRLEVLYINLSAKSCAKVNMYSKTMPNVKLVCTDSKVVTFYNKIGNVGQEFILEIKDLQLEKNEVIYLKLDNRGLNISVRCSGNQKNATETPTTTKNPKIGCKEEENTKLYIIFGGIIAGLIVIIIILVCIGIYCCLRNRKSVKGTNTNVDISIQDKDNGNESQYSLGGAITDISVYRVKNQQSPNEKPLIFSHFMVDNSHLREATPDYNNDNFDQGSDQ